VTSFDRAVSLHDLLESAFLSNGSSVFDSRRGPALDVHEDTENVTISLDVPGLKKEDFEISLHDGELTISGERKAESREGETLRNERFYGRFSRTVSLASPVKADGVAASYTDGILKVTLPKSEEAKPRRIAVS